MYILYLVTNLALWLLQIKKLYLLSYWSAEIQDSELMQQIQSLFLVYLEAWSAGEGGTNKKKNCKAKGLHVEYVAVVLTIQIFNTLF